MNTVLTPNLSERKRIIGNICKENKQWKPRMILVAVLFALAAGIMIFICGLLILHPTSSMGLFIWILVGICFAVIPLLFGISEKNKAKFRCALPYTTFANGSLFLNDSDLDYVFWRVGPHEPAAYSSSRAVFMDEDKFVYSIRKKDIKRITIKDDICLIKGDGRIVIPDWANEDDVIKACNKEFSFITAFDQSDAAERIKNWLNA